MGGGGGGGCPECSCIPKVADPILFGLPNNTHCLTPELPSHPLNDRAYFQSAVTLTAKPCKVCLTWNDGDSVLLPGHHTDVLLHSRGDEALEDGHVAPHGPLVRHANCVRFPEHCSR